MNPIEQTYRALTPRSAALAERACVRLPGGDTRAAGHHLPYPLTLERAEGPHVFDVDGRGYLDLIGNFTSLVHGNAYPPIVEAITRQAARGTAWPARNEAQLELAEEIACRAPSIEQLRFTNSGTEATMLAAAISRAVTGRRKVLMARYGYHGSLEDFELGFFGHEEHDTLLAPFGDAAGFEAVLDRQGAEIACVILEPVMGSAGLIASPPGFLERVRAAAHAAGALFVLDEVITLRLAVGGAQALHDAPPDLTALGKIIGGGLPVGAIGGRRELLAVTHPDNPRVFHSGTFNGNPLTAAAGLVSLRHLTAERIERMHAQAEVLVAGLRAAAARVGLPFSVNHAGSLVQVFFAAEAPSARLERTDGHLAHLFHLAALNHGLFFSGRGLMALSTVLGDDHLAEAVDRAGAAMADVARTVG
ncbi:MAG: aspartate aminotransferase family protein [Acidimicrobiales bacterium]